MKRNFPGRRIGSSERREIGASGLSTSWADCLSHLCARVSHVCTQLLEELPSRAQCVREAQDAATVLAREGTEVPEWSRFTAADFRAPQPVDPEVGEWTHGWQFHVSIARNTLFATSVHLPPLSTDHRPPSLAGITTRSLRFAPLQQFAYKPRDHLHGRGVPHAAPGPFAPTPPHGRESLQVRRTVGLVRSPHVRGSVC